MPPPIAVQLKPYTPEWAEQAALEIRRLTPCFGENLVAVHHVGSTAIPGILAKPILDLMPVVRDLAKLDGCCPAIEALGYQWWGEYGIPERRYCTLNDPATARRKAQLHCFPESVPDVERHLAFRDYLRVHAHVAHDYEALKIRCRALHPLDSHAYTDCKSDWIRRIETEALAFYRADHQFDPARERLV